MPRTNHCSLIAILLRSMAACFFRCFGLGYSHRRHLVSSPDSSLSAPAAEPVVSRNHKLSSLFESEERDDAVVKDKDSHVTRATGSEFDDWQLKDEAKFLKACGTLQETPDEIRKLSKKLKDVEQDSELKYHSWLPNISASQVLKKDELSSQHPAPVRFDEEDSKEIAAAIDSPTPSSCIINEQSNVSSPREDEVADDANSTAMFQVNGKPDATNMSISPEPASVCKSEFLTKSVRFATQPFLSESSPQTCIQRREKPDMNDDGSLAKRSPYPTPLNVTVDMQTPGTVFASGNNARVRSQYVYTSMSVSETLDQSPISQGGAPFGSPQNSNCNSEPSVRGTSIKGDLTLSSWMNQPGLSRGGSERKYKHGNNWEDRPIIGLVAEHWKEEDDDSHISPKEWDGNGIPNTTTKYKEDQKVHWHATPFEERLEKALSDESFIPRRKPVNMEAVVFEDDEERDTATCKLESLKPSKPLASY